MAIFGTVAPVVAAAEAVIANADVVMDVVVMENDCLATLASELQVVTLSPYELQASEEAIELLERADAKELFSVLVFPDSWKDS